MNLSLSKITLNKNLVLILIIISLGLILRIYNYNWDMGNMLHPDERFMGMTLNDIKVSSSLSNYLNVEESTMSPENNDKGSYIYGTFPLFFVKILSRIFNVNGLVELILFARVISAIVDTLNILLVFYIAKNLFSKKSEKLPFIAAFLYATSVSAIQQSHFFTVDVYYLFWINLSLIVLLRFIKTKGNLIIWGILLGICFGLALASKSSAIVFALPIIIGFLYRLKKDLQIYIKDDIFVIEKSTSDFLFSGILFGLFTYITFRFNQPYFFENSSWLSLNLSETLWSNLKFQQDAINGKVMFPPQWQWVGKKAFIHPLSQLAIWYVGIPVTVLFITGLSSQIVILFKNLKNKLSHIFKVDNFAHFIVIIWLLVTFIYFGRNFVKPGRYLLAVIPVISIYAGFGLVTLMRLKHKAFNLTAVIILLLSILYTYSYMSIYFNKTTRVTASEWIYANIPVGSNLLIEHWDDGLPVSLTGEKNYTLYMLTENTVYDADDDNKLRLMYSKIMNTDYIILSSPRAKWTIGRLENNYPFMVNYYTKLDNGELGFKLVKEVSSYPSLFGVDINDSKAEEPFWIYDHPPIWIYKKEKLISFEEFEKALKQN